MLYTVTPLEQVYKNVELNNKNNSLKEVVIDNIPMQVSKQEDKTIVHRVLSTNLEDYLNSKYQPGMVVDETHISCC